MQEENFALRDFSLSRRPSEVLHVAPLSSCLERAESLLSYACCSSMSMGMGSNVHLFVQYGNFAASVRCSL